MSVGPEDVLLRGLPSREWQMEHGTNVVVVSIQSNSSKKFLLFADWLFTTTTFVPWDILWAMVNTQPRSQTTVVTL